jgi:hypothetical protein
MFKAWPRLGVELAVEDLSCQTFGQSFKLFVEGRPRLSLSTQCWFSEIETALRLGDFQKRRPHEPTDRLLWDRRVALGIYRLGDVSAEYNSEVVKNPRRSG